MRPPALYDTELAGRLAGFDRVNLATMVERLLGLGLAKGHGAADWSKRPLPAGLAQLRRPRRGTADRTARGDLRDPGRAGQNRLGCTGIRIPADVRGSGGRAGRAARPLAANVGHPPGARPSGAGRGSRIVDDARPDRPAPRHRAAPDPAGFGHHRRRDRRPEDGRRPGRAARVRRAQPAPQRRDVAGGAGSGPAEPGSAGGEPSRRTGHRRRRGGAGANPRPPHGWRPPARRCRRCRSGWGFRRRTWSRPTWCDGCAGTGTLWASVAPTRSRSSRSTCAPARRGPWQRELVVPVLAAATATQARANRR